MRFFFNDTATTEIYTLSLHDALPICALSNPFGGDAQRRHAVVPDSTGLALDAKEFREQVGLRVGEQRVELPRSEEHTSELQSRQYLVCRLLLEKKITLLSHLVTPFSR